MLTQSKLNQLLIKIRILKSLYPNRIPDTIYLETTQFFNKIKAQTGLSELPNVDEIEIDRLKRTLILEWYKVNEEGQFIYCSVEFLGDSKIKIKHTIDEDGTQYNLSDCFEDALKLKLNAFRKPRRKKKYK